MIRDFGNELTKQLRFLRKSCEDFDIGDQDEGVRIAAALAVIFHDTGSSQSLLSHLNLKRIHLLSTSSMTTYAAIGNLTSVKIDLETTAARFLPKLDSGPKRIVPFKAWWNREMIFRKEKQKICRRDLVLSARNKDGGAHVDATLEPAYEWVADGAGIKLTHSRQNVLLREWKFESAHLASLRQIGFEVLNSPSFEPYL